MLDRPQRFAGRSGSSSGLAGGRGRALFRLGSFFARRGTRLGPNRSASGPRFLSDLINLYSGIGIQFWLLLIISTSKLARAPMELIPVLTRGTCPRRTLARHRSEFMRPRTCRQGPPWRVG